MNKRIIYFGILGMMLLLPLVSAQATVDDAFARFAAQGGTVLTVLKWLGIGILALIVFGGGFWWRWNKKRYIYTIEVWGSDGGIPDMLIVDKARPVKVRTKEGISSLLYIKKLKRYIKNPPRDFFRNNKIRFWYRKDGELTPIRIKKPFFRIKKEQPKESEDAQYFVPYVLEDVNERFEVSNVTFINEDARLSHVSTGKIIREMFNIEKFLAKHGNAILLILGVIVMAVALLLVLDGAKDYYGSAGSVASEAGAVSDNLKSLNEAMLQTLEELRTLNKQPSPAPSLNIQTTSINSEGPPDE